MDVIRLVLQEVAKSRVLAAHLSMHVVEALLRLVLNNDRGSVHVVVSTFQDYQLLLLPLV